MDNYCLYLRKSRADLDAEAHGEGETLARHEKILLDFAKRNEYNVTKIYKEIVSGETISARPVMQQLLQDVGQGLWKGVLVVELERLARGDTMDQGLVAQTFKASETEIITPLKKYDPNNEYDEEYFEFGLFMSRREYKTIMRRMVRGRLAAAKEGKWTSGIAPYGYERVRLTTGKGWTLEIKEDEAEVVRLIFRLYTSGSPSGPPKKQGTYPLCNQLDRMSIPPPSNSGCWSDRTIRQILQNPVYIGKIRYNYHKQKKTIVGNDVKIKYYTNSGDDLVLVDGLHPPIVDKETFDRAQEILAMGGHTPVPSALPLVNPLAGILFCGKCGRAITMFRAGGKYHLRCSNKACDNVSSKYSIVEERLLQALSDWLSEYRLEWGDGISDSDQQEIRLKKSVQQKVAAELDTLKKQLARTYDLLEQGIYDSNTFLERSRELSARIGEAEKRVEEASAQVDACEKRAANRKNIVPKIEKLLDLYHVLPDAKSKNEMLKSILDCVYYTKLSPSGRSGPFDNFDLEIVTKLPDSSEYPELKP